MVRPPVPSQEEELEELDDQATFFFFRRGAAVRRRLTGRATVADALLELDDVESDLPIFTLEDFRDTVD